MFSFVSGFTETYNNNEDRLLDGAFETTLTNKCFLRLLHMLILMVLQLSNMIFFIEETKSLIHLEIRFMYFLPIWITLFSKKFHQRFDIYGVLVWETLKQVRQVESNTNQRTVICYCAT